MSSSGTPGLGDLKLLFTGSIDISHPVGNVQTSGSFTHNLGYKPAFLAFWTSARRETIYYPTPYLYITPTGTISIKVDVVATQTTLDAYIITPNISASPDYYNYAFTWRFYFYVFKQDIDRR